VYIPQGEGNCHHGVRKRMRIESRFLDLFNG
jgi:hypothetical protein